MQSALLPGILRMQSNAEPSMNTKKQRQVWDDDDDEDGDDGEAVGIYGENQCQEVQLPDELIFFEILTRLPVKSLIRFKSVSKQWESLISSHHFAKIQLKHTVASPNFSADPSSRSVVIRSTSCLRILNFASYDEFGFDSDKIIAESDEFECPNWHGGSPFLIGSANGLVCVGVKYDELRCKCVVYNPCTGDHFASNEPPDDCGSGPDGALFFGFGYVSSSDDYKILIMKIPNKGTLVGSNFVYSLRCDSWESYDGFGKREMAILSEKAVLVHETLHYAVSWRCCSSICGSKKKKKCIAAFNLDSEEFDMVTLPWAKFGHDHACCQGDSSVQLSTMNGCLCVWAKYCHGSLEMWMLKQYEEWDSWTKMFNLNTYLDWGMYPQDFFGFSLTGKILVRTDHKELVLVNIGEGVSKYVTLRVCFFQW